MTAYELFMVASEMSNRLDVQWGLFLTVHLGLFGGIIYVDRPLRRTEKLGALLLYGGFVYLNFRLIVLILGRLERAYMELAKLALTPTYETNELVRHYADHLSAGYFDQMGRYIVYVHIVAAIMVLLAIVFDRAISAKGRSSAA